MHGADFPCSVMTSGALEGGPDAALRHLSDAAAGGLHRCRRSRNSPQQLLEQTGSAEGVTPRCSCARMSAPQLLVHTLAHDDDRLSVYLPATHVLLVSGTSTGLQDPKKTKKLQNTWEEVLHNRKQVRRLLAAGASQAQLSEREDE